MLSDSASAQLRLGTAVSTNAPSPPRGALPPLPNWLPFFIGHLPPFDPAPGSDQPGRGRLLAPATVAGASSDRPVLTALVLRSVPVLTSPGASYSSIHFD